MINTWPLQIEIDKNDVNTPIYQQVYNQLVLLISSNTMRNGDVLPSSRELAIHLSISRKTVVRALEMLIVDGWIISKERIGLFVRDNITKNTIVSKQSNELQFSEVIDKEYRIVIDDGIPNSSIVPIIELSRAYRQIFTRYAKWHILGYIDPRGNLKFREEISSMLNKQRGLQTTSEEICITRGSQMGLYLTANAFLQRGDTIIVEQPGYTKAHNVFKQCGINIEYVGVDEDGIDIDMVKRIVKRGGIKAIYATPQHQYPTTVTLSNEKRIELIELATKYNFYLIEDDYDCDFHFTRRIIMPLSRLLPKENYIYIGSFSKIIAPSVRIGFIAAHESIINRMANYRSMIDVQGDNIMELAVLELIKDGEIRKHLKRSVKYYKERRDYFASILQNKLSSYIEFSIPQGGLAFWLCYKSVMNIEQLSNHL
ncbi:MAG: PLP-dependent aminotransferase family protein, partial [Phocaeicola sp.]